MKRWPVSKAHTWEEAPFLRLLLPLISGIIFYDQGWLKIKPVPAAAIAAGICTAYCFVIFKNVLHRYNKALSFVLVMASIFSCGICLSAIHNHTADPGWFGHTVNNTEAFTARIEEMPQEKEKTWKLSVSMQSRLSERQNTAVSGKAFMYVYKDSLPFTLHQGDVILFPNKMQPVKNTGNPYEFDYARYAARNNLYYQQFVAASAITVIQKAPVKLPLLVRCHNWCIRQLQLYLTDKATLGLMQAMLAGDETGMDSDLRNVYAQTGIIHIVSISGSHVAVLFAIVSGMLWWLRSKKFTVLKYIIALLPVWFYVLMAGAPPSAIRAAVMFTILAGGVVLQRNGQPLNTLLAAAFFLLCANPSWLFSVGFQLSFIAVLSLIVFYGPLYRLWQPGNLLLRKTWQGIVASISAEILIAPLVIYYFHSFPAMFIVANLLAALCMGALLIAGMLLLACTAFPPAAKAIGWCCILTVQWFNKTICLLGALSPRAFNFLQLSAVEILLVYIIIAGTALWLMRQRKTAVFTSLAATCLLLFCLCADQWRALRQEKLIVYSTGRSNYAEIVSGKYYTIVCRNDSLPVNRYAPDAVHTHLHAWRAAANKVAVINRGGQRIVVLEDTLSYTADAQFHAGILIIATPLRLLSFNDVVRCFHPGTIVLPSGQSRWYAAQWKDSCAAHQIGFHNTAVNGAFVLNLAENP